LLREDDRKRPSCPDALAGNLLAQSDRHGQSRGKDNGWFWKTRDEWEAELGLSRWEQETARKQLRHTKFWLEKDKRLEHKIFFSIDFVELEKALEQAAASASSASTPNTVTAPICQVGSSHSVPGQ